MYIWISVCELCEVFPARSALAYSKDQSSFEIVPELSFFSLEHNRARTSRLGIQRALPSCIFHPVALVLHLGSVLAESLCSQ